MKSIGSILILILLFAACEKPPEKQRILVFSKTSGYRHESIGVGKQTIISLGEKHNFDVDTTEDARTFNEENLKRYRAVVFLNTTQDVLNTYEQADFERFIQAGGGYVGIHAAADTEYEWPWYGKLAGAYFKSHPKIQEAKFKKQEKSDLVKNLPDTWMRTDELYNYKDISDSIHVLYTLDESSYTGGENGNYHPIAWYHTFDGGRAFYTGMGHTQECYTDSLFLDHITQGINYAMGSTPLDYTKAKTIRIPEENRFNKVVLKYYFDEPTEMAILPDNRIIFLERKGTVKLYDPKEDSIQVINTFKVWTKSEDGMLGLTTDPDFSTNHWLYIYYSHPEKSVNVLSRFVFDGMAIEMASEKQLLEVPVQRETCCHTGGSLAFDPHGNLFISTGDNTSPFESDGYGPADEREGRAPFDAQKSSSNTNDLRGKILRIHPENDGTYSIPDGNLFAKDEAKTKPEIYVMGNRNPYRISVDKRTDFLYWGEVGPDAGTDDEVRGPRGYDEVNQARKPGYFGWPYFVGKNYAYGQHDFATGKTTLPQDALKPKNHSPNNTGKVDLPPVSAPFIWYPYARSVEFPLVKQGGRNAMAGPVYYSEDYKGISTAYPNYLDGKLIIYDWMRNWMMLVTMDAQGNYVSMEPFLEHMNFNNIIDMAFGPDGRLYTLEYGTAWFKKNNDARLSRIDFNGGNRIPQAVLTADKEAGDIPLTITFSAHGTADPDGDKINYQLDWDGHEEVSTTGNFVVKFDKKGIYKPRLTVKDSHGASSSAELMIVAGNETPQVSIAVSGNAMFFFPDTPIPYTVDIKDKEDGTTTDGKITTAKVSFDYLPQGYDMTLIAQGHQRPEPVGKGLIASSDCKACHMIDQKSAGPAYRDVAKKYKDDKTAAERLTAKVIKGGAGVWGTTEMSAHPQLKKEDVTQMIEYILSLSDENKDKQWPLKGVIKPGKETDGAYILTASYKDKGAADVPPLEATSMVVLRKPSLTVADLIIAGKFEKIEMNDRPALDNIRHNTTALYKDVDLTNIGALELNTFTFPAESAGGEIEVYLDNAQGEMLGRTHFATAPKGKARKGFVPVMSKIAIPVNIRAKHNLFLVFINPNAGNKNLFYFSHIDLLKR